jgi:glycosyltransferase involved in cell wall biosynthesis
MKILVIAPFMPWPLAHGGRIRLYHLVRELARLHDVTLACLTEDAEADRGPLTEICRQVVTVTHLPKFAAGFFRFLFGSNPYNVERYVSPQLLQTISRLTAADSFDLVHLETTHIWSATAACGAIPVVLGTQNVESRILAQLERACHNPLKRILYRLETTKMRRFEENAWRCCRLCLTVSDDERTEIIKSGVPPGRVVTIPNGVDLERFNFNPRSGNRRLLFLGGLDYNPNLDAVRWLLDEIWPLIRQGDPAAQLLLAGRNTTNLASARLPEGVKCLGDPADVPGCFGSADVLLVPLRIGAGTRLKVLEAMAAGLPVVTTSRGCEGTSALPGEHLLAADTPAEFAAACLKLLAEPGLAAKMAANARQLVEEHYSWEMQGQRLAHLYAELSAGVTSP